MCRDSQSLLTIDQVPRFLRYNYYIRSGYRHPPKQITSTPYHLFKSIFSWHNESINIWTHLFGLLMFAFLLIYELLLRNTNDIRICVTITCAACVVTFFGSIMYHCSMNKCHCQSQYKQCLNYDVLGVICACTFSAISPIVNGYKCNYNTIVISALVILLCSFTYVCLKTLAPKATAALRAKYIGIHALLRIFLSLSMVYGSVLWQNRYQSLKWHMISFFALIIGGGINVFRYPEKLFVNKYVSSFFLVNREELRKCIDKKEEYSEILDFIRYSLDYIGNSHQIWHIFVIVTCVTCYYGCVWDHIYSTNTVCSNEDLYDLVQRNAHANANAVYDNLEDSAMYAVALDFLFDPKFLYPF